MQDVVLFFSAVVAFKCRNHCPTIWAFHIYCPPLMGSRFWLATLLTVFSRIFFFIVAGTFGFVAAVRIRTSCRAAVEAFLRFRCCLGCYRTFIEIMIAAALRAYYCFFFRNLIDSDVSGMLEVTSTLILDTPHLTVCTCSDIICV